MGPARHPSAHGRFPYDPQDSQGSEKQERLNIKDIVEGQRARFANEGLIEDPSGALGLSGEFPELSGEDVFEFVERNGDSWVIGAQMLGKAKLVELGAARKQSRHEGDPERAA